MPSLQDLSDAAIAINKVLQQHKIDFGIFGGYAVNLLGGDRVSKDIDCAIGLDKKEQILDIFKKHPDFRYMGNSRPDCAIFMYGTALIEFFPTSMNKLEKGNVLVRGTKASNITSVLDPCSVFKGKLRAAVYRDKHRDSADLLLLADRFQAYLKGRNQEFDQQLIGHALKRSSHLEPAFVRLGIDVEKCKRLVAGVDPKSLPREQEYGVQRGLLFGLK